MLNTPTTWLRALTAGLALAVAGCTVAEPPPAALPVAPRVAATELVHTVYFPTDSAVLPEAEAAALRQFAAGLDGRLVLEQLVVGHADVRAGDAHNDALSARRAAAVAALLRDAGLPAERISVHALGRRLPVAAAEPATSWRLSRRVEVVARGVVLIEPGCPDWSRPSAANPGNLPTSNFGCATTVNFMRMLADPRDLLEGAPLGPADGTREAAAVARYRTDSVKQLQVEAASQ